VTESVRAIQRKTTQLEKIKPTPGVPHPRMLVGCVLHYAKQIFMVPTWISRAAPVDNEIKLSVLPAALRAANPRPQWAVASS